MPRFSRKRGARSKAPHIGGAGKGGKRVVMVDGKPFAAQPGGRKKLSAAEVGVLKTALVAQRAEISDYTRKRLGESFAGMDDRVLAEIGQGVGKALSELGRQVQFNKRENLRPVFNSIENIYARMLAVWNKRHPGYPKRKAFTKQVDQ